MGQEAGGTVSDRGQAQPSERHVGAPPCRREDTATAIELPAPVFASLGGEADILPRGHLREQRCELKGAGDAALTDARGREPRNVLAGETYAALAWLEHSGDEVKQGRFAGAVRTNHGAHLALLDPHRYVVDCDEAAEAAGQLIELQQRHCGTPALLRFCGESGRG